MLQSVGTILYNNIVVVYSIQLLYTFQYKYNNIKTVHVLI